MKLLADENFPPTLISFLQKKKNDVKRVQRSLHGVSDKTVKEKAILEKRIIVSFDKDYLESKELLESPSALVLDFPRLKPEEIIQYMDSIIIALNSLRKRKKPFTAVYSKEGLRVIS